MKTPEHKDWSYSDLVSVAQSLNQMLEDEAAMKEFQAISDEFRVAESDGLDAYENCKYKFGATTTKAQKYEERT